MLNKESSYFTKILGLLEYLCIAECQLIIDLLQKRIDNYNK